VVVLKAGRSEAGADAVSSHTGRLAGSDRVVGGAFRQYGVQRVFDDEELCDAAKTLSGLPPASGNRVAILTPAGGYGVMGADHVEMPGAVFGWKWQDFQAKPRNEFARSPFLLHHAATLWI
jgi:acetate---CoA ligase (ADP-forming)